MKSKTPLSPLKTSAPAAVIPTQDTLVDWAATESAATKEALLKLQKLHQSEVSHDEMWPLIQARAYELFSARGGESGHALNDWLQAEREIDQHFGTQALEAQGVYSELRKIPKSLRAALSHPEPRSSAPNFSQI